MKYRQLWSGILAGIGMLVLILDGKLALEGARTGIDLCMKAVIPSLFPFFVLSILLTGSLSGQSFRILRPVRTFCGLPEGSDSILISGFLGGYPIGAQCIGQYYRSGALSQRDAQRMLGFCSNAGPAFLFGLIGPMFTEGWIPWALWGIHMGSALLCGRLMKGGSDTAIAVQAAPVSITQAVQRSVCAMAQVCGWIILFRVLLSFLQQWLFWCLPVPVQVALFGFLELSNGCSVLGYISSESLRFLFASGMLAFGGLCVTMQTASVTSGLSLRYYLLGKLYQTLISLFFSWAVIRRCWFLLPVPFLFLLKGKKQKKSSFPETVRV